MSSSIQYNAAGTAYDQAFNLYSNLPIPQKDWPYRMLWYQTGPYWAYYYTGRYQDVINLANTTLGTVLGGPTLEESLYWRGMAEGALGRHERRRYRFQICQPPEPQNDRYHSGASDPRHYS